ncbi:hypothetical protein MXL24_07525 [Mammaliicoccus sciuri]|uniref:hypothetical protein n=1 Tax=Mammaliicoccus sciuri TaxID=1296 RepID=UPI000D1E0918|nr:hypothetical protein [Mammaliicoccus sciuri]MEB6255675.1 hypothetical protein [Mammaliicoccus sciuri]MEB7464960.1 hypothetical protein [Mammaliicoccus sciuri]PTJ49639.1 hypothetical protein BU012_10915 [Mammaliicoccus sciuri]UTI86360.1 hypothetical protein NIT62_07710 [Mammaliicoccus sciuri]
MYSETERDLIREQVASNLINIGVNGIIQIGSGVKGYNDQYSDLDMMIVYNGDLIHMIEKIKKLYYELGAFYIKELQLRENIYLITPFFENGLEINSSLLPINLVSIKSPLWKIVHDDNGSLYNKVNEENEKFNKNTDNKKVDENDIFEFMYARRKLYIALKRNDLINANQMLEMMRDYVLEFQVKFENKKLHQFKAYSDLQEDFQEAFMNTFPPKIDLNSIETSCEKVSVLLENIIKDKVEVSDEIRCVGSDLFK